MVCHDLRWLLRRGSPLPIPNREVKPLSADGTAVKGGRVSRCQILLEGYPFGYPFFMATSDIVVVMTSLRLSCLTALTSISLRQRS